MRDTGDGVTNMAAVRDESPAATAGTTAGTAGAPRRAVVMGPPIDMRAPVVPPMLPTIAALDGIAGRVDGNEGIGVASPPMVTVVAAVVDDEDEEESVR